ncbi:MAG: PAS domain S-box protein [Candidatus Sulfotelmatobacter sp.]
MQLILNALVEGICGVDARGNATFCNQVLLSMTGYSTEEVIGKNAHALMHQSRPDGTGYPEEDCPLRKALDSGQKLHLDRELIWQKGGTSLAVEYWVHPLQECSSETVCVVTVHDISERELATAALRTSEERFQQISNNIDQAFYLVDVIGSRLVYASPAFETITGHSFQEACEKPSPWRDLAVPEHREKVIADYTCLLAGEETKSEYQIRHSDGSTRWVKDHAKPIRDASGRVCMFAGVAEDITAIHEAREVLHQSEERFRRILTSVAEVAWTSDQRRRTIYVSPKVESVLGYTKEEICSAGTVFRSGLIHPEDFGRVNRSYNALFEGQSAFDEEYRIRRKDGTWIWVHDRAMGVHQEEGVLYADGVFSDITRRKQAEAELQWKTAFLEAQANSTIDGILVVGGNNKRLLHNQRFVELFHVSSELANNKDDGPMLQHVTGLTRDPESFMAKVDYLNRYPAETGRDEIEFKDGTVVDRYSAPVIDKEGNYYGRIWTFRDITERKRNEETLQKLSLAVEQSPASVMITTARGEITYVNQKFTEVTGYQLKEVEGKNPRLLNAGVSPPEHFHNLWSTITCGDEWKGELCNRKKSGEIYWEAATIRPITDAQGTITSYLALKEDITERRRAGKELLASRQMLQSILDAIPQRVFWKDRNSIYLGCNRPFATDAGLDRPEEIVGKSDFDLLWKEVANLYRADDKMVMERRVPKLGFQERQTRPDGSVLWLQTCKLPLLDLEGKVTGIVCTYEDITERRRAERELWLTKASLENASAGVFWIDPQAHIVYANEAACRSLEYSRDDLVSLSVPDIDPGFPPDAFAKLWEECKTRGSVTIDSQHKTKRGRVFPVEITASYLEFDGQEYSFAFVRDISERRKLEAELRQAHKLEGIGQLSAGIAHEINTPTQFVTDNLTFLRDSWKATCKLLELYRSTIREAAGTLSSAVGAAINEAERDLDLDFIVTEVPHAIEQSLDGAQRVAKIVRAMKEFSHPDSAEKTNTDLNRAIESTITVARNEWKYVAEMKTEFDKALPAVQCYPGDINQVILNVLVNAAHAIKEKVSNDKKGLITIRTCKRGEFAEISVTDSGAGIPEAIRTRIFDPFFTTKEVGKGTGQGLSLAHSLIVKKHAGKIWFETEIGRGTTFFIDLPIKPV